MRRAAGWIVSKLVVARRTDDYSLFGGAGISGEAVAGWRDCLHGRFRAGIPRREGRGEIGSVGVKGPRHELRAHEADHPPHSPGKVLVNGAGAGAIDELELDELVVSKGPGLMVVVVVVMVNIVLVTPLVPGHSRFRSPLVFGRVSREVDHAGHGSHEGAVAP